MLFDNVRHQMTTSTYYMLVPYMLFDNVRHQMTTSTYYMLVPYVI